MERDQAIKVLENMEAGSEEEEAAVSMSIDAIRKQIPAPLKVTLYCGGNSKNYDIYCPCGAAVSYPNRCCNSCGQVLDWDEIAAKVFDVDAF